MDWQETLVEAVAIVGALLLVLIGMAAAVAAAVAGIWGLAHLLPWVVMHNRTLTVFLVLVALLLGGSRADPVLDRLGAIHTTLMMRR